MTTIKLSAEPSKGHHVVANSYPAGSSAADHRKGNIEATGGATITWEATAIGPVSSYTVRFLRLGDNGEVWPFKEMADGTLPPVGVEPKGPLVLPVPGKSPPQRQVKLTAKDDQSLEIKYEVDAVPTGGGGSTHTIDSLDPVIIIRPAQISSDSVLLGVTCAVVGAIAGAAATWALS